MRIRWTYVVIVGILLISVAFVAGRIFKPRPLPSDNAIQQAVTKALVEKLMLGIAERRIEERRRDEAIRQSIARIDSMYQRLDLPAIQEQAHDTYKNMGQDSIMLYLADAPIELWERAVSR